MSSKRIEELEALYTLATAARDAAGKGYEMAMDRHKTQHDTDPAFKVLQLTNRVKGTIYTMLCSEIGAQRPT